jgi:hypothetical protein
MTAMASVMGCAGCNTMKRASHQNNAHVHEICRSQHGQYNFLLLEAGCMLRRATHIEFSPVRALAV